MARLDLRVEEFKKFVAIGESTTAGGWSTSRARCWVSRLGELINDLQANPVAVVNVGIGGNVISKDSPCYQGSGKPAADERLDRHVILEKPDLLVVSYGLNDARGGTQLPFFRKKLTGLVQRVRAAIDPVIVLLGPYYMTDFTIGSASGFDKGSPDRLREFNQGIAQVASEQNCLYVDLLNAYGNTHWMIHDDGVHANDLGHRIVANRIFEVLAQNCSGLAVKTKKAELTSPRWRDESTLML